MTETQPNRRSRARLVAICLVFAFVCLGCGSSDGGAITSAGTRNYEQPGTTELGVITVQIVDTEFGQALGDAGGFLLYQFDGDERDASVCIEKCIQTWLPQPVGDALVAQGLEPTLLSGFERADGIVQASWNGRPLYRFAGDNEPGETKGVGTAGRWWLIAPNGTRILN